MFDATADGIGAGAKLRGVSRGVQGVAADRRCWCEMAVEGGGHVVTGCSRVVVCPGGCKPDAHPLQRNPCLREPVRLQNGGWRALSARRHAASRRGGERSRARASTGVYFREYRVHL